MRRPYQQEGSRIVRVVDLKVGTVLWVCNGCWRGEIVEVGGVKAVRNEKGVFKLEEKDEDYVLEIITEMEIETESLEESQLPY